MHGLDSFPCSSASIRFNTPARVEMGMAEFMISWFSTRISFCHESTSFSSISRLMSLKPIRVYAVPLILKCDAFIERGMMAFAR